MRAISTAIHDVFIIEPEVFKDSRGFFLKSWNQASFNKIISKDITFVQDNHSHSFRGVLRGLHYQINHPQGKLVRVISGRVLDVAVDIRRSSPTFGCCVSVEITGDNYKQLWIPAGCAHGFVVLSQEADFFYKTTDYYYPEHEKCIKYNDSDLNIDWKMDKNKIILSDKDCCGLPFSQAEYYE
jgi:dTDP-4-dehydrorhamnose 3,5-epimerase